jgi:sulfite reductase (NADPH) flavoprotein alpha-component
VGEEAHLLISAVRYETHGRARKGVASNYVAERLKRGGRVRVKLKPNKHFALPAADRDIIMVGPGTGVAPFRAFVQERRATAASASRGSSRIAWLRSATARSKSWRSLFAMPRL